MPDNDNNHGGRLRQQMQSAMETAIGTFFCTTCRARKPIDQKMIAYKRSLCLSCLNRRKAIDAAMKRRNA